MGAALDATRRQIVADRTLATVKKRLNDMNKDLSCSLRHSTPQLTCPALLRFGNNLGARRLDEEKQARKGPHAFSARASQTAERLMLSANGNA
jgi:hypothetical protein